MAACNIKTLFSVAELSRDPINHDNTATLLSHLFPGGKFNKVIRLGRGLIMVPRLLRLMIQNKVLDNEHDSFLLKLFIIDSTLNAQIISRFPSYFLFSKPHRCPSCHAFIEFPYNG